MRTSPILAASSLLLAAASAHAGMQKNGSQINGPAINGSQINGSQINGSQINGSQINGSQINGVPMTGVSVSGSNVSISFVGANSSCPHREDVTGSAMAGSCSPCAQLVVNSDSYCSTYSWDSYCTNGWGDGVHLGAAGLCSLQSKDAQGRYELNGQSFKMSFADGSWAAFRVDAVAPGATSTDHDADAATPNLNMSDVLYHTLSYTCAHSATAQGAALASSCSSTVEAVCAGDPFCCNGAGGGWWDGYCVAEANSWTAANKAAKSAVGGVCGMKDTNGDGWPDAQRRGIFVAGRWNLDQGYPGAGGKSSSSSSLVNFACEGVGAVAKCVDMGYKPWASSTYDREHQSCVRMVRADYCGNGISWTQDGMLIDVEDVSQVQLWNQSSRTFRQGDVYDASWGPTGSYDINVNIAQYGRRATLPSGVSTTLYNYYQTSGQCSGRAMIGWPNWPMATLDTSNKMLHNSVKL
jgi:hypothetical protein